jgi:hypothetical protein
MENGDSDLAIKAAEMGFESPPSGGLVLNFREALQTRTQTTTESS